METNITVSQIFGQFSSVGFLIQNQTEAVSMKLSSEMYLMYVSLNY